MTEIKIKKVPGEHESQEQRHWNIVQLQNTWLALGITVLGLGIATASLSQKNWTVVILLVLFGVSLCVFSRQIAFVIFRVESNRIQNVENAATRRIVMPNSLKNLATVAAWVLLVLGCISLVCSITYIVLTGFNVLSVTSSNIFPLLYTGFGILCLILTFVAAWIRSKVE